MTNEDYESGLRAGRIEALEQVQRRHDDRLSHHDKRLQVIERIIYGLLGALVLIETAPLIKEFL